MTKLEILEETFNYYTEDPIGRRGVDKGNNCVNITLDGKMCAFGRCMINPDGYIGGSCEIINYNLNILKNKDNNILYKTEYLLDTILKEEYRGHDVLFWQQIQNWHDLRKNWDLDENTISNKGLDWYNELKKQYNE